MFFPVDDAKRRAYGTQVSWGSLCYQSGAPMGLRICDNSNRQFNRDSNDVNNFSIHDNISLSNVTRKKRKSPGLVFSRQNLRRCNARGDSMVTFVVSNLNDSVCLAIVVTALSQYLSLKDSNGMGYLN